MARPVRRRTPVLLASAVGVVVLAGCGGGGADQASPFPERPVSINVDLIDPCSTLSDEQRRTLGLSQGQSPEYTLTPAPSRGCAWSDFTTGYNFTVQTLPLSAEESVGAEGTRLTEVSGFGAVEATSLHDTTPICQLVIDADEARSIRVQAQSVLYGDDGRPRDSDLICPRAAEVARAVLHSVTAQA
ncbi:DUF3558 family protein [Pseudonocardia parietis]|uniref:DUF3558 domain-containing protein n=1 Tax=Pseudonocardia parietis TaxID=570936 RepID=A0ABS4VM41_9PSEU|nr:DUF3558 family protein [Pseudonocardia parietis]MBP2364981.1 hypothetical protein [Pseudonocardia parietis]